MISFSSFSTAAQPPGKDMASCIGLRFNLGYLDFEIPRESAGDLFRNCFGRGLNGFLLSFFGPFGGSGEAFGEGFFGVVGVVRSRTYSCLGGGILRGIL